MSREIITTKKAPGAIGPYSQGVKAGGFVFTAGQVGLDPGTGRLVEGGVGDQTRRAMQNLEAILAEGGSSLRSIVRTTVYLKDIADFGEFNKAYAEFFTDAPPPARVTVGGIALPLGALVEIEAVAELS